MEIGSRTPGIQQTTHSVAFIGYLNRKTNNLLNKLEHSF